MTNIIFTIAANSDLEDALFLLESAARYTENTVCSIVILEWPEKIKRDNLPHNINLITLDDLFPGRNWIEQAFQLTELELKAYIRPFAFDYFQKKGNFSALYLVPKCLFLNKANYLKEKMISARAIMLSPVINIEACIHADLGLNNNFLYLRFDDVVKKFIAFWIRHILDFNLTLDPIFHSIPIYLEDTLILHVSTLCCNSANWRSEYGDVELFDYSHHSNQSNLPKKPLPNLIPSKFSKKYGFSTYENGVNILTRQRYLYRSLHPKLKSEINNPFEAQARLSKIGEKIQFLDRGMLKHLYRFDLDQLIDFAVISSTTFRIGLIISTPVKRLLSICSTLKNLIKSQRLS